MSLTSQVDSGAVPLLLDSALDYLPLTATNNPDFCTSLNIGLKNVFSEGGKEEWVEIANSQPCLRLDLSILISHLVLSSPSFIHSTNIRSAQVLDAVLGPEAHGFPPSARVLGTSVQGLGLLRLTGLPESDDTCFSPILETAQPVSPRTSPLPQRQTSFLSSWLEHVPSALPFY